MANFRRGRSIVGYWDCKHCDKTGISGELRNCPSCGKARDENTTFYMNLRKIQYVPKKKAATINRNPDWICMYCNQLNSDNDSSCISCGAVRTEKNDTYKNFNHVDLTSFSGTAINQEISDFQTSDAQTGNAQAVNSQVISSEAISPEMASPQASKVQPFDDFSVNGFSSEEPNTDSPNNYSSSYSTSIASRIKVSDSNDSQGEYNLFSSFFNLIANNIKPILIVLLVLALIAGCVWIFSPKYYDVTVEDFSWNRNINIEKWQTVNESGWTLPVTARLHYTREEFSHYEQVFDHYETKTRSVPKTRVVGYEDYVTGYRDLGNGYFEEVIGSRPVTETYYETETYQEAVYRDEPVYRTKYYYEIDKWLYERTVTTKASNHSPYWGEPNLSSVERVSSRNESYSATVFVHDKEKEETYHFSYEDWNSLNLGDKIRIKVVLGVAEIVTEE